MRKLVNIFSLLIAFAVLLLALLMYIGVIAVANKGRIIILVFLAALILVMTVISMKKQ